MDVFFIENDELLKKSYDIWNKLSCNIKTELNSKPVYNKKILQSKIKFYGDKIFMMKKCQK